MTVLTTTSTVSYQGNGATKSFDFAFKSPAGALVITITAADGTESTPDEGTYTVTGHDDANGGTVTFGTAPAAGTTVTLVRQVDLLQEVALTTGSAIYAEVLEAELDRQAMVDQQLHAALARAVKVPIGSSDTPEDLLASISEARETAVASAASAVSAAVACASDAATASAAATLAAGYVDRLNSARLGSVAALRANTEAVHMIYLEGYRSVGDGGEGQFFRVESGTDNGGTVFIDAIGQVWQRGGTGDIRPQWFGAYGDGVHDDSAAIAAALAVTINNSGPTLIFNALMSSSRRVLNLSGKSYLLASPVQFPSSGGGDITIRDGLLRASATFDPARWLLEANTSIDWFPRVTLDSVSFDGNGRAGNLRMSRCHGWLIRGCWFTGYAGAVAVLYEAPSTSNRLVDCFFYERPYGVGSGAYSGTALRLESSDITVSGCYFGYGMTGIEVMVSNIIVRDCHFYGLTGWAFDDHGTRNAWESNIFDDPARVRFYGPSPGYESRFCGNSFLGGTYVWGALVHLVPTVAGVELSAFVCTGNRFVSSGYAVPSSLSLTLSAATFGPGRTLTASAGWFSADMIGATIAATEGALRITAVTSSTVATVEVTESFAATAIAAGAWTQQTTSVFASTEVTTAASTLSGTLIGGNTHYQVQKISTSPTVKRAVSGLESFEIQFGRLLLRPGLFGALFSAVNSSITTAVNGKIAYISTTYGAVAIDFEAPFTGTVICEAQLAWS